MGRDSIRTIVHEYYDAWWCQETEVGSRFAGAEYIRIGQRRISQILVVNNSPEFSHLVE